MSTSPIGSFLAARPWRATVLFFAFLAVSLSLLPVDVAGAVDQPVGDAQATVETTPVSHSGDAADDPAIWRNPIDPSRSIVIGNDKGGALEVYDLAGARIQRIDRGVLRQRRRPDRVRHRDRDDRHRGHLSRGGVRVYAHRSRRPDCSPTSPTPRRAASPPRIGGEGICLYRSPRPGSSTCSSTRATAGSRSGRSPTRRRRAGRGHDGPPVGRGHRGGGLRRRRRARRPLHQRGGRRDLEVRRRADRPDDHGLARRRRSARSPPAVTSCPTPRA